MMNAADVDLEGFTAFEGGAPTTFSSPAVPSAMDFGMSSSASTLSTVSPHDLHVQDPFLSTPDSAALTALTSPSIYDNSPNFGGFDVSPHFGSAEMDGTAGAWFSLFPQDSSYAAVKSTTPEDSPIEVSDELGSSGQDCVAKASKKVSNSPISGGRHSSVAGVNARKRDKPLPPIVVDDPNDTVAMKRARNTLAARKSRERKAQRFDELDKRIAELEAERDHWKAIALSQSGAQE